MRQLTKLSCLGVCIKFFYKHAKEVPGTQAGEGRPKKQYLAADFTSMSEYQLTNWCRLVRQLIKSSYFGVVTKFFYKHVKVVLGARAEAGQLKKHCPTADFTCMSQYQLTNWCGLVRQLIKSSYFGVITKFFYKHVKVVLGAQAGAGRLKKHCAAADFTCLSQNQLKKWCGLVR